MKKLILTTPLALLLCTPALAAPPVESYYACTKGHQHVHINKPSSKHAKRHGCKSVKVDPVPTVEAPGPKAETPAEASYRVQMLAAQARARAPEQDIHAANERTRQTQAAADERLEQEQGRLTEEILVLRGFVGQFVRFTQYLIPFLPTQQQNEARALLAFVGGGDG